MSAQRPEFTYTSPTGKQYKLKAITWRLKDELAQLVMQSRLSSLRKLKSDFTPEGYDTRIDAIMHAYEDGDFALEQPAGKQFFSSVAGQIKLAALIFGCSDDEMVQLVLDDQPGVLKMVELVVRRSLRTNAPPKQDTDNDENSDPNLEAASAPLLS